MRTRSQAFDVVFTALNLAQDLSYEAIFVDPAKLKRRYRWFANRTLLAEMNERQKRIEGYVKQAYELQNLIGDWADEYPLEGSNTKVSGGDFPTDSAASTLPFSQEGN